MYDFLLVINSNFGPVCYRFRDIDTYRLISKIAEFSHPPFFEAPASGNPLDFCDEIWRQKTSIVGLPDGEKIMTLGFFVLTQYRLVTDRRADRRTDTLRSPLPALA